MIPSNNLNADQKQDIREILGDYCPSKNFDSFILKIDKGIGYYLLFKSDEEHTKDIKPVKQVKDLQKTFRKLSKQLGELHHANVSSIDCHYLLREREPLPVIRSRGKHFYGWNDSMQSMMIDLDIACSDYLKEHKPIKGAHGWESELHLVFSLYEASIDYCPQLKISEAPNSKSVQIMDYLVAILNIKSKHTKKRNNAYSDPSDCPEPLASGKSIIHAWLNHPNGKKLMEKITL